MEVSEERVEGRRRDPLGYSISPAPVGQLSSHGLALPSPEDTTPLHLAKLINTAF